MCLQFGFVIFWRKDFGAKAAHKMLVKLTPVVYQQSRPMSTVGPLQMFHCLFQKFGEFQNTEMEK
jgi:hypothetical protein